jgi:hypothetical protein
MSNDVLFRNFKEADGYKLLVDMLIEGSASESIDEKQVQLGDTSKNLRTVAFTTYPGTSIVCWP